VPQLNHFTYGFYDELEKIAGHPLAFLVKQLLAGAAIQAGGELVGRASAPKQHPQHPQHASPGEAGGR